MEVTLTKHQLKTLEKISKRQKYLREKRIQLKMINRNTVFWEGKGYYYYIEYSRPNETIMDVITSGVISKYGGYAVKVAELRKGNYCDFNFINRFSHYNQKLVEIGANIDSLGGNASAVGGNSSLNDFKVGTDGKLDCDIVIIKIGGTHDGILNRFYRSSVQGDIIIRTISRDVLDLLNKQEQNKDLLSSSMSNV